MKDHVTINRKRGLSFSTFLKALWMYYCFKVVVLFKSLFILSFKSINIETDVQERNALLPRRNEKDWALMSLSELCSIKKNFFLAADKTPSRPANQGSITFRSKNLLAFWKPCHT